LNNDKTNDSHHYHLVEELADDVIQWILLNCLVYKWLCRWCIKL